MIQVNGPMVRIQGTSTTLFLAEFTTLAHTLRNYLTEDPDIDVGKANFLMTQFFVDALSIPPDQNERTEGDTT